MMTDPHRPEPSAGEEDSAQGQPPARSEDHADGAASQAPADEAEGAEADGADDAIDKKEGRKGLLLGVGGAVLGVAIVALVLAAFAWPGFLAGPGTPDDTATRAVAALASKDPAEVDKVACRGQDGKPVSQLPPQALQVIQSVAQTGAPELVLDTQAQTPVDLTLSAQGQTQNIPADVVLGVTDGEWCMTGISQRQQPAGG